MKAALIHASHKASGSASAILLRDLEACLPQEVERFPLAMHRPGIDGEAMSQLASADAWVFALPLYVDGVPAHVLRCLNVLERFFGCCPHRDMAVYALVNCGFYEGEQAALALEILKNWCGRATLTWGQGLGVGGGGMLAGLPAIPAGKGPKRSLGRALSSLAGALARGESAPDCFVTADFPRIAYKLAAEMGWRRTLKANGLKAKDLFRRP